MKAVWWFGLLHYGTAFEISFMNNITNWWGNLVRLVQYTTKTSLKTLFFNWTEGSIKVYWRMYLSWVKRRECRSAWEWTVFNTTYKFISFSQHVLELLSNNDKTFLIQTSDFSKWSYHQSNFQFFCQYFYVKMPHKRNVGSFVHFS